MTGSYDPKSKTTYWGTGNPVPMFDPEYRPGDNLYTNSSVALDVDTGKLKWHFQFTPHDVWDYDAEETPALVDTTWQGQPEHLGDQVGRDDVARPARRDDAAVLQAAERGTDVYDPDWQDAVEFRGVVTP